MRATTLSLLSLTSLVAACGSSSETPTPTADAARICVETVGTADAPVCVLEGVYTTDLTLTADQAYLLRGGVFIGDDATKTVLTIEPGVTIYGELASKAFLTIRRGSMIIADGTADAPIVFTSSAAVGRRARGDWGGLVINGRAPLNVCGSAGCSAEGEGGTGAYGGDDADDNSGVLRYVRVEFAGNQISPENELNGVSFQGVGRGTTVDYLQAHMGADDGIEFFGGTVDARHVLVTAPGDDAIDWTYGWQGRMQFAVVQQYPQGGDNGIEADNYDENNLASPMAEPTLANLTLIGSPDSSDSDIGVLLREGTGGHLCGLVVMGFNEACVDIDDPATFDNAAGEALSLTDSIIDCAVPFLEEEGDPSTVEAWATESAAHNTLTSAGLVDAFDITTPDFRPAAGSPALFRPAYPSDAFFTAVDYIGGVDPADDWTLGWTTTTLD